MTSFIQQVAAGVAARGLLRRGGRVLVAVSGGLDSMVLLHTLNSLAAARGWKLAVAHFNHQLRGRSSDRDETLVRKTVAALKLPLTVERADVKGFARSSGLSLEMAARKLRHEFLARTARAGRIPTLALAHHADDQVELFFLRLLRGAGGEGLAGMKWRSPSPMDKRITLVRPLLDRTKDELGEFARAAGIVFRTDATNLTRTMPRNRVRNELLPLLRAHYQPGLTKTVLRVMEIAGAEADLARELAAGWLAGRRPAFAGLPVAVQRRVVQTQLLALGLPVDFDLVEQLRLAPGQPVSVGLDLQAMRDSAGTVTLQSKPAAAEFNAETLEVSLSGRAGTVTFADTTIAWERIPAGKWTRPVPQPGREVFDADRVGTAVELRHWRAGDRFQPLGMKTPVKLQDLFTNARIPRDRRRGLLVAVARGEIFWVEGLRMAERFKLSATTKERLVWRWRRGD
jgi:tRNA(Ile)-lysidine synthase